jgi:hypothetical protein
MWSSVETWCRRLLRVSRRFLVVLAALGLWAPATAPARPHQSWGRFGAVQRGSAPSAPVPSLTGPIPGTIPPAPLAGEATTSVTSSVLTALGYQQQEYFLSGTANAYGFTTPASADGRWSVAPLPSSGKPYTTRIEVFTPTDPRRFSGNVIVEWENVTAGWDYLPDMIIDHATAFEDGDAIVAVSAQFVGVENAILDDPGRYASLSQPGDSYAWDIFSQAGMAIRKNHRRLFGGIRPVDLIADGESQSAEYLATYIDGFAGLYNVYDGYLVHSRGNNVAPLQLASYTRKLWMRVKRKAAYLPG